jgi:phage-related protein
MEVRVAGLVFRDWPDDYEDCLLIDRNGFKGWRGGDQRREEIARPGAHGAFTLPGYQVQKTITLDGTIIAPTPEILTVRKNTVTGALANGDSARMLVDDQGEVTWRDVQVVTVKDPEDLDDVTARFALTFWAANPRRYGTERTFAAGEQVFHRGNFAADPVIEVTGPRAGYTISTDTGKSITIGQALATGQKHRIEMRTGRIYRDGALQTGAITAGGTWTIPPTSPGIVHSISAGGPMSIVVTDTFI